MLKVTINKQGQVVKTEGDHSSQEFTLHLTVNNKVQLNPSALMKLCGASSQIIEQESTFQLTHAEVTEGTVLSWIQEELTNSTEFAEMVSEFVEKAEEVTNLDENTSDLLFASAIIDRIS